LDKNIETKPLLNIFKGDINIEELRSEYLEFTVNFLKSLTKKQEPLAKLRLGIFCDYMMKFHLQPKTIKVTPEQLAKNLGVKEFIANFLLSHFAETVPNKFDQIDYVRSNQNILKLVYHILIVAMMLYDYKLNISPLARTLKLETKKLIQYCREIGCSVDEKKAKEDIIIASLKAPLTIRLEKTFGRK
jgi:hypothetical protein